MTDLFCLRPLFRLSQWLGLAPNYDFAAEKLRTSKIRRCYCVLILLAETVSFFTMKFNNILAKRGYSLAATIFFLNVVDNAAAFFANVTCVLKMNFWGFDTLGEFLKVVADVDERLARFADERASCRKRKQIYAQLFAKHVVLGILLSGEAYIKCTTYDVTPWPHIITQRFQIYQMHVLVLLMKSFADVIETRFELFNAAFRGGRRVVGVGFLQIHSRITDLIDLYNDLFGWQFLLVNVQTICTSLTMAGYVVVYFVLTDILVWKAQIKGDLIFYVITSSGYMLVLEILVIRACYRAHQARQKILAIGHKLLHQALYDSLVVDEDFTNAMRVLLEETANRKCRFSAAGFFEINYTLVPSLLSTTVSYLLVIVQFR